MQWGAVVFSMDLGSGKSDGHVVVALRGELDLMDAAAVAVALGAVAADEPRIIVDLAGLEFIDASGVAALSLGRLHARNAGGDLLLAAPQRLVRRVLAIIWEVDGFAVHASVTEAAASTGAPRRVVAPVPRQATKLRWQRMAMNPPV
jgi:anti-sigma B factor antagonist